MKLDPITNLPQDRPQTASQVQLEALKGFDMLDKKSSSPTTGTETVSGTFGKYDPQHNITSDRNFNEGRAQNQTGWQLFGNSLGQGAAIIVGGALETVGYMGQLLNFKEMSNRIEGSDMTFDNWMINAGAWVQNKSREDWNPIYQTEKAQKGFALGDATWWASQAPSIASTLAMMIPAVALRSAVMALGRVAGTAIRGSAKATTLTKQLGNTGIGAALNNRKAKAFLDHTGSSVVSRHAYNSLESRDVFETVLEEKINEGKSEEEARSLAGQAAAKMYRTGYWNIWKDMIAWNTLLRGQYANRAIEAGGKFGNPVTNRAIKNLRAKYGDKAIPTVALQRAGVNKTDLLTNALGEGFEEFNIQFQKSLAFDYADYLAGAASNDAPDGFLKSFFSDKLIDHAQDRHTWDATLWGFMGGLLFGGAAKAGVVKDFFNKETMNYNKVLAAETAKFEHIQALHLKRVKALADGNQAVADMATNEIVSSITLGALAEGNTSVHVPSSIGEQRAGTNIENVRELANTPESEIETQEQRDHVETAKAMLPKMERMVEIFEKHETSTNYSEAQYNLPIAFKKTELEFKIETLNENLPIYESELAKLKADNKIQFDPEYQALADAKVKKHTLQNTLDIFKKNMSDMKKAIEEAGQLETAKSEYGSVVGSERAIVETQKLIDGVNNEIAELTKLAKEDGFDIAKHDELVQGYIDNTAEANQKQVDVLQTKAFLEHYTEQFNELSTKSGMERYVKQIKAHNKLKEVQSEKAEVEAKNTRQELKETKLETAEGKKAKDEKTGNLVAIEDALATVETPEAISQEQLDLVHKMFMEGTFNQELLNTENAETIKIIKEYFDGLEGHRISKLTKDELIAEKQELDMDEATAGIRNNIHEYFKPNKKTGEVKTLQEVFDIYKNYKEQFGLDDASYNYAIKYANVYHTLGKMPNKVTKSDIEALEKGKTEKSKTEKSNAPEMHKGIKIVETADIVNAEGVQGAAQYNHKLKVIKINRALLRQKFAEKAWTNPRVLSDGSQVNALPENQFTSYEQFEKFVIEHEYQHSQIPIKKFKEAAPFEEIKKADYENAINNKALESLDDSSSLEVQSTASEQKSQLKPDAVREQKLKDIGFEIRKETQSRYYLEHKNTGEVVWMNGTELTASSKASAMIVKQNGEIVLLSNTSDYKKTDKKVLIFNPNNLRDVKSKYKLKFPEHFGEQYQIDGVNLPDVVSQINAEYNNDIQVSTAPVVKTSASNEFIVPSFMPSNTHQGNSKLAKNYRLQFKIDGETITLEPSQVERDNPDLNIERTASPLIDVGQEVTFEFGETSLFKSEEANNRPIYIKHSNSKIGYFSILPAGTSDNRMRIIRALENNRKVTGKIVSLNDIDVASGQSTNINVVETNKGFANLPIKNLENVFNETGEVSFPVTLAFTVGVEGTKFSPTVVMSDSQSKSLLDYFINERKMNEQDANNQVAFIQSEIGKTSVKLETTDGEITTSGFAHFVIPVPGGKYRAFRLDRRTLTPKAVNRVIELLDYSDMAESIKTIQHIVPSAIVSTAPFNDTSAQIDKFFMVHAGENAIVIRWFDADLGGVVVTDTNRLAKNEYQIVNNIVEGQESRSKTKKVENLTENLQSFLSKKVFNVSADIKLTGVSYTSRIDGKEYASYLDYLTDDSVTEGGSFTDMDISKGILTTKIQPVKGSIFHNLPLNFALELKEANPNVDKTDAKVEASKVEETETETETKNEVPSGSQAIGINNRSTNAVDNAKTNQNLIEDAMSGILPPVNVKEGVSEVFESKPVDTKAVEQIEADRKIALKKNEDEWSKRALSAQEDGVDIFQPESFEEQQEWKEFGTPVERSIKEINAKYDAELKALNTNQITQQQKQQAQQAYSNYLESLNKPNTNPVLQDNQQEQLKKFAELQERLNNKEFIEGAKVAYESSDGLKSFGTQEQYNDYIARVSLGIVRNPSSGEYNYTSKVKDIVYHGTDNIFDKFDKNRIGENTLPNKSPKLGIFFSDSVEIVKNAFLNKNIIPAILNIKNPNKLDSLSYLIGREEDNISKEGFDGIIGEKTEDPMFSERDMYSEYSADTYIVFEPEQIHILGSKQDIQGFKEFVGDIKQDVSKLFDSNDKKLKKGSVVEYNGNKYLFWNDNNGKAQLINTDGTKFSGTPNIDKLTVLGGYATTMYNNTEYIVTDNDNVYSGATGKLVYTGKDNSSITQKNNIINQAKKATVKSDFKIETSTTLNQFLEPFFNSNNENIIEPFAKKLTTEDKQLLAKAIGKNYKDINEFDWQDAIWSDVGQQEVFYYLKTGNTLKQDIYKEKVNSKLYKDSQDFKKENREFVETFKNSPVDIKKQQQEKFDKIKDKNDWYHIELNNLEYAIEQKLLKEQGYIDTNDINQVPPWIDIEYDTAVKADGQKVSEMVDFDKESWYTKSAQERQNILNCN